VPIDLRRTRRVLPVRSDVRAALWRLAEAEARAPRTQASLLIADGLRRAGYLPDDWTPGSPVESERRS
jgi:hypothetical protein